VSEDSAIASGSVKDWEKPTGDESRENLPITSGERARGGTGRSQKEERKQPSVSLMGHPALHDWTVSRTDIGSAPTHSREIRGDPRFQLAPLARTTRAGAATKQRQRESGEDLLIGASR